LSAPDLVIKPISHALTGAVELVADVTCPWCYVGFRRLRRLQQEGSLPAIWRPFLLNPHLPAAGIDRRLYRQRKFGSVEAARRLDRRLVEIGASEGIAFAFDRIERTSPTLAAHGLLLEAQGRGLLEMAAERLFAACFVEGRDLGDPAVLTALGGELGLSWSWTSRGARPPHAAEVLHSHQAAVEDGVTGVPLFQFRPGFSIAGAQPMEALRALRDLARLTLAVSSRAAGQGRQAS
jgi:predicted DsbA family dithiol-disulfide isomerase